MLALLFVALLLALPVVLSMDWVRVRIQSQISAELGTPCHIGGYSFGLLSGLEVRDVGIDNPKGFDAGHQLFAMRRLHGDVSLIGILRGRFGIEGSVEGLALRIYQRKDGTTNLGELLGTTAGSVSDHDHGSRGTKVTATGDIRLDLQLSDSFIEVVHEENGVLERMEHVAARIAKDFDSNQLRIEFGCDLARADGGAPGRLEIAADARLDPEQPVEARVRAVDLDLARYRPILATFLAADRITAFAGVVTANTRITGRPRDELLVDGSLDIVQPHFAGPLFGGFDFGAPRWTLSPGMTIRPPVDGRPFSIDCSKVTADLGFLTLKGLPNQEAKAGGTSSAGIGFELDVAALAARGGPLPASLRESGTKLSGNLHMPLLSELSDIVARGDWATLIAALDLEGALQIAELKLGGQSLGLDAAFGLQRGKLRVEGRSGRYGGGPLAVTLGADATKLDTLPLTLSLDVDGAKLGGELVPALRYVFPLAAGAQSAAGTSAVDVDGRFGLHLELSGNGVPQSGQDLLAWLDGFSGKGHVGVQDGSLTPAAALGQVLQLTGDPGVLRFSGFQNDFRIAQGFIETLGSKLDAKGKSFGLSGRTSLAGALEWGLDVKPLLADHKDGATVLKYLGDAPIGAALTGTLDAPRLAMPAFDEILKQAVQRAVERGATDLLKKEAGSLLDSVLGGRKGGAIGDVPGLIPGTKPDAPGQPGAAGGAPGGGNRIDNGKTVLEQVLEQGGRLPQDPAQLPPSTTRRPDPIGDMLRQMLERKKAQEQSSPPPGGEKKKCP